MMRRLLERSCGKTNFPMLVLNHDLQQHADTSTTTGAVKNENRMGDPHQSGGSRAR